MVYHGKRWACIHQDTIGEGGYLVYYVPEHVEKAFKKGSKVRKSGDYYYCNTESLIVGTELVQEHLGLERQLSFPIDT